MMKILFIAAAIAVGAVSAVSDEHFTYDMFVKAFGKEPSGERLAIFEANKAAVIAHNANPASTFKKTIQNRFADMKPSDMPRGYVPTTVDVSGTQIPFDLPLKPVSDLPKNVDWRTAGIMTGVKDQGQCGSCWAFASTATIEAYAGLSNQYHSSPVLSPGQLVQCAANPNHCGGVGGCMGSVPELAFDYIAKTGMTEAFMYGYTSYWGTTGTCHFNGTKAKGATPAVVTIEGHTKLPSNNYTAVMNAIASIGPLAINVAAASWGPYAGGIYQCTEAESDIDHVVVLAGYGETDAGEKYWLVRNSWSSAWGEGGYIRLARSDGTPMTTVDKTPADGTGCDNGPSEITIAGPCGLLWDTSFVVGAKQLPR